MAHFFYLTRSKLHKCNVATHADFGTDAAEKKEIEGTTVNWVWPPWMRRTWGIFGNSPPSIFLAFTHTISFPSLTFSAATLAWHTNWRGWKIRCGEGKEDSDSLLGLCPSGISAPSGLLLHLLALLIRVLHLLRLPQPKLHTQRSEKCARDARKNGEIISTRIPSPMIYFHCAQSSISFHYPSQSQKRRNKTASPSPSPSSSCSERILGPLGPWAFFEWVGTLEVVVFPSPGKGWRELSRKSVWTHPLLIQRSDRGKGKGGVCWHVDCRYFMFGSSGALIGHPWHQHGNGRINFMHSTSFAWCRTILFSTLHTQVLRSAPYAAAASVAIIILGRHSSIPHCSGLECTALDRTKLDPLLDASASVRSQDSYQCCCTAGVTDLSACRRQIR